jgi:hypothetical protein
MLPEPSATPPEHPTEATRSLLLQGKFAMWRSGSAWKRVGAVWNRRGASLPKENVMGTYLHCHDCGAIQQQHPHIDPGWVWITLGGVRQLAP